MAFAALASSPYIANLLGYPAVYDGLALISSSFPMVEAVAFWGGVVGIGVYTLTKNPIISLGLVTAGSIFAFGSPSNWLSLGQNLAQTGPSSRLLNQPDMQSFLNGLTPELRDKLKNGAASADQALADAANNAKLRPLAPGEFRWGPKASGQNTAGDNSGITIPGSQALTQFYQDAEKKRVGIYNAMKKAAEDAAKDTDPANSGSPPRPRVAPGAKPAAPGQR